MKKKTVIDHFGSQTAVANALNSHGYKISRPAVTLWSEDIPMLRAYQIEKVTKGELRAEECPCCSEHY